MRTHIVSLFEIRMMNAASRLPSPSRALQGRVRAHPSSIVFHFVLPATPACLHRCACRSLSPRASSSPGTEFSPDRCRGGWIRAMADRKKTNHKNRPKTVDQKPALKTEVHKPFRPRDFLKSLGPGLITGASDDDPSGIGTYSQAGAQLGYGIGWTMLLPFPLMAAIQEISARVGRVTGHGISGNVCRHYPSWLLSGVVALLFIANTINIAADLGAMADATKLLIGGHGIVYVVLFGVTSVAAQIFLDYHRYVAVLKWLTLSLFAYVGALAFAHISWGQALTGVLVPRITWSGDYFTSIVAIFVRASPTLIALSIIVTAAATLHAAGKTDIQTSAQAAEALKPIAGAFAEIIFAFGLLGAG